MRNKIYQAVSVILAAGVMLTSAFPANADQERYLALGQDLTADQRQTVESLLGVEDESQYQITYVTNEEEYENLGNYISADQIGTKALSSAVVTSKGKGEGISVETQNITYCSADMYRNALITAGVSDVDVKVAGPMPISGTAALVGITKIYANSISNEPLKAENVDAANDELATTQELGRDIGQDQASELIAVMKQKAIDLGSNYSRDEISNAIDEYCQQNNISLTDDEKTKILDLIDKLQQLDLDPGALEQQAKDIYDNIKGFLNQTDSGSAGSFFSELGQKIASFFQSIIDFFSGNNS